MNKKALVFGLLAAVLGAGGAGAYAWHRAHQRAEVFAAAIPAVPDLSLWPEPMRRRVEAAERKLAEQPLEGLAELSRLYHANGFFADAAQCYTGLTRLQPREPRWFHLHATILAGYGDNAPALALWQRTVELAPDYVPARLRLGDVHLRQADFAAAAQVYREILAAHPNEPYAQLGLARCEYEAGRWEPARRLLEPLVTSTNFNLGYDLIVTVYERLGLEAQARAVRGRMRESGAYRDAADPWADALADDCYDVYRLSLASGTAHRYGDIPQAFRRIQQALELAPDQATLHFQLGGLHASQRAYSKARQCFELCTRLKPDFSDGWVQYSIMSETLGDRAAADQATLDGLRNCPNSPGLHLQYAQRLLRDKRPAEAIPEFEASIRLRPNEAPAYLGLASALISLGRREEGLAAVDGALVAEPGHPLAIGIRAFDAIETGDELGARRWLQRAQEQPRFDRQQLNQLMATYRERFGRAFE